MTLVQRPVAGRVRSKPSRTARARAAWWRHPETPFVVVAGAAWIGLGIDHFANHDGDTGPFEFHLIGWTVMVLAMMLPGVLPMVRYVAFNSLWSRRHRSAVLFTAAYVAAWVGLGVIGWAAITALEQWSGAPLATDRALVGAGVVAVGWQFTRTKFRALRRCHLRMPLAARGPAADRSAINYGLIHGRACVGSCWAIMFTMLVTHNFHLMVPLALVTIVERYQKRPTGTPGAAAIAVAVAFSLV